MAHSVTALAFLRYRWPIIPHLHLSIAYVRSIFLGFICTKNKVPYRRIVPLWPQTCYGSVWKMHRTYNFSHTHLLKLMGPKINSFCVKSSLFTFLSFRRWAGSWTLKCELGIFKSIRFGLVFGDDLHVNRHLMDTYMDFVCDRFSLKLSLFDGTFQSFIAS